MKPFKTILCIPFAAAVLMAVFSTAFVAPASAQSAECVVNSDNKTVCPPARSLCLKESTSGITKCSPPDGGVMTDRYGAAQCGAGRCAQDIRGDIFCAKDVGGAAAKDQYGDTVCSGGCVRAQASLCTTLTR